MENNGDECTAHVSPHPMVRLPAVCCGDGCHVQRNLLFPSKGVRDYGEHKISTTDRAERERS